MTKLETDLALAHALIENKEKIVDYYWKFYRMWSFTTINMKEYLEIFDLKNKRCVTIQGSSDHVFELFLKEPSKIIGVDTNPLTEYYFYLKYAAFEVLSKPEEFLKFFRWHDYPKCCQNNYNVFDNDVYQEISKYLIGDSKLFWDDLFGTYNRFKIRTNLFNAIDEENDRALYNSLSYLSLDNYEYIRNNRHKINFSFMNTDIRNLVDVLSSQQDFITLSNLIIYAYDMYPDNPLLGFKKLILELSKILSKDGQIMVGYLYDIENEEDYREIYQQSLRDVAFKEPEFFYHYVKRIADLHCDCESKNHDACLIYRKKG